MNYGRKMDMGNNVITFAQSLPDCIPTKCIELSNAETGSVTCNSGFCVNDPVQGSLNDCYLIAGLASVAWAAPATMATKYAGMVKLLSDKKIPVIGSSPCYARIGPRSVIWPLIYERAYAYQKGCDPCANPAAPTKPTCIEGGVGLKGLTDITGWPKKDIQISSFNPTSSDPNISIPNNNGFASVPAVAWTLNGDPGNKIPGSHTFSYLGHTTDGYVVLRNPYGSLTSEPTANKKGSGTWFSNCCLTIDFGTPNDGIFGLTLAYFKSKFAGIGYVTQR